MSDLHLHTRPWESGAGDGPRLRGRRADGAGPLIHFLPGNGFCGGVYWPFLKRFLPRAGLFLHDIEGHGDSDAPENFSGVRALLRRIRAVMSDQGLPGNAPLIGMGHSFGAALTLRLAAEHPQLFRAVVLLDPITLPGPVWAVLRALGVLGLHPLARAARRRRRRWKSREEARERLRGRGIYEGWPEEALDAFVSHALREDNGEVTLCCPPELEAQIYEHPIYPWRALPRVRVPVLFLHGQASYPFLPVAGRLARRLHPGVRVATAPGRHCFMLEHPDEAHRAVARFLAETGS